MSDYIFSIRNIKLTIVLPVSILACVIILACSGVPTRAQSQGQPAAKPDAVEKDIQSVNEFIDKFQQLYSSRDFEGVRELFMGGGAVVIDFSGKIYRYSTREWLDLTEDLFKKCSTISDRLTEREIDVYRNIAVVRCRYDFDSPYEHSTGHDIFSLIRHGDSWLIVSLMYSGDAK
jgi:hypothetical protein